ncbi:MAG TPA: hypothetical protein VFL14_00080 [Xanthomonadales bacterium]|nr:hypothetical protein [Xanthomonadales bacterium]
MTLRRIALAVALAATLAACNKPTEPAPSASPEAAATPAPAESPAATTDAGATGTAEAPPVTSEEANAQIEALAASSTGAPIGIPACDDYLTKYEACISEKVPEPTRETLLKSLAASREAWRQSMSSPGAQAALESACTQAREAARPSLQAYGCTDM